MLDLLAELLKPDEFLLALAGHVANEGAAKLTVSAVKAVGFAILGFAFEDRERASPPARKSNRRGRQKLTRWPPKKRTVSRQRRKPK